MKVSVIIPTYNRPGYLAQAVHSVLQQTHPVLEIIIVDDGSSTIHRPKIDTLKQLDDRISALHLLKNKGVSAARNYGLEKSEGDYILFLDDDDMLHPHMVDYSRCFLPPKRGHRTKIVPFEGNIFLYISELAWSDHGRPEISSASG